MFKEYLFKDNIYGYQFIVTRIKTDRQEEKLLEKYDATEVGGTSDKCVARTVYSPSAGYIIIYVRSRYFELDNSRQVGIIAHEAWHATEIALFGVGCDVNKENVNEHLAYYVGFVAEHVSDIVNNELTK